MTDDRSNLVVWSEAAKNWAAVIAAVGALIVFSRFGCAKQQIELSLMETNGRIAKATETANVLLRDLEVIEARTKSALDKGQTALVEFDLKRRQLPSLKVTPVVVQASSSDDVRHIRLELNITNDGETEITVKNINSTIYVGRTTLEIQDLIEQTIRFSKARAVLSSMVPSSDDTEEARALATKEVEMHRERCPHGRAFLIAKDSKHVRWEKVPDLAQLQLTNVTLRPRESASHVFNYLITDAQTLHYNWFLFEITINDELDPEHRIEFILPGAHSPSAHFMPVSYTATTSAESRWEPTSPLIPLKNSTPNK
jgi:hypothetical protein